MKKRILSAALALSLCAGLVPAAAFAEEAAPQLPDPAAAVQPLAAGDLNLNDAAAIPDPVFRNYLLTDQWYVEGNGDGVLTAGELSRIKELYPPKGVTDLTGIEYFPNLERLICAYDSGKWDGSLQRLDVSHNPKLAHLSLQYQNLATVDLSQNPNLVHFEMSASRANGPSLTALDLSHNPNLDYIRIDGQKKVTALDLTHNPNLTWIDIENTGITELDLSNNKQLKHVSVPNTGITRLDLRDRPNLTDVFAYDTPLQDLNVEICPKLKTVSCSRSQLTSLKRTWSQNQVGIYLKDCAYTVNSNTVDLTTLPGRFDVAMASNWQGGTVEGNILTFTAPEATYTYDIGYGSSATFKLVRGEVPDVPVVENKIELRGNTLSLDGEIFINHYVDITGFEGVDLTANGGILVWNTPVTPEQATYENAAASETAAVRPGLTLGENGYGQSSPGIAAKEYSDERYLRAYVLDNEGVYHYGPLTRYSVRTYAENMIRKEKKAKEVCIELLHYGAAAQLHFGYNTGDLANKNIAAQYPAAPWDPAALTPLVSGETTIVPTGDVQLHGHSLVLDGAITMKHYYYQPAFAVQDAQLLVWNHVPGTLTEANAAVVPLTLSGEDYAAASVEVPSRYYGDTVFVCARFTDAAGAVHYSTVTSYSPETYASKKIAANKNATLVDTLQKMVMYGEAAQRYFAQ